MKKQPSEEQIIGPGARPEYKLLDCRNGFHYAYDT